MPHFYVYSLDSTIAFVGLVTLGPLFIIAFVLMPRMPFALVFVAVAFIVSLNFLLAARHVDNRGSSLPGGLRRWRGQLRHRGRFLDCLCLNCRSCSNGWVDSREMRVERYRGYDGR